MAVAALVLYIVFNREHRLRTDGLAGYNTGTSLTTGEVLALALGSQA